MADCGAAGTTIDRTVGAVAGRNTEASKHVASFLGQMSVGPTAMPLTTPSVITAANSVHNRVLNSQPSTAAANQFRAAYDGSNHHVMMDQAWFPPQQHQHNLSNSIVANTPALVQQQQQQQHLAIMQQQQMMHHNNMIMQQQLNFQKQQKLRQMKQESKEIQQKNAAESERWIQDLDDAHLDEDDLPQGVSMDELAAAWAQAEAEYDAENIASMGETYRNFEEGTERPYTFQNHHSSLKATEKAATEELLQLGIQEYERGNLPAAIKAFESLIQLQDENNAKAWFYLGKCHAENDMDTQAIACLERSMERDPFAPETLLALGVSHVNEMNYKAALQNLKEWITHNPKYASLSLDNDVYGSSGTDEANDGAVELDQVQRLLLRALEHNPSPDIQEALGVVYNVSRDYDAAVASIKRALENRPNDYSLWNKLGATLANANRSEEALPAYQEALQRRPNYVRGWLNMAISHSNLQNYHEAARCYLQTLSLNPNATHCWSYLRVALSCEEEWDLLPLIAAQDLKSFREHYDFVLYDR